ncbi:hypothetical protein AWZ03_012853 [Drosophila navojoa]|uniref:Uncharacterized protein n=1 Tax=Drosophila navojoa TaxID=7232 RepID=A0A484AYS2_DRONA|nr:hypothetical protein AWZ03_012853 [Drosophila navojoa]
MSDANNKIPVALLSPQTTAAWKEEQEEEEEGEHGRRGRSYFVVCPKELSCHVKDAINLWLLTRASCAAKNTIFSSSSNSSNSSIDGDGVAFHGKPLELPSSFVKRA